MPYCSESVANFFSHYHPETCFVLKYVIPFVVFEISNPFFGEPPDTKTSFLFELLCTVAVLCYGQNMLRVNTLMLPYLSKSVLNGKILIFAKFLLLSETVFVTNYTRKRGMRKHLSRIAIRFLSEASLVLSTYWGIGWGKQLRLETALARSTQ